MRSYNSYVQVRFVLLGLLIAFLFPHSLFAQQKQTVSAVEVTVRSKGKLVACNVRIYDSSGYYFRPDSSSVWKDFTGHVFEEFASNGTFRINLPFGKFYYEADRGPAYKLLRGHFVADQKKMKLEWNLEELVDPNKRNWWAGETHIHRKPADVELLMKASDLYVGEVVTSWNDDFPSATAAALYGVKQFDNNRYCNTTATEDERGGGALLFFNLSAPFDFRKQQTEYPPLAQSIKSVLEKHKNAWVDLEKPFWPDVPILLATQKINSVGIANNHMLKKGIFDNEAWGKKRDTAKYPSPLGNAYYAQDLYYQVLNAGFRMPPSAGSASGVLWNPVGYNRLYAHVEAPLTYERWWDAVRKGNCFVSNGPLLFCKANAQLPGSVFKIEDGAKQEIKVEAEFFSRDSLSTVEIIKNGKLYATVDLSETKHHFFESSIIFDQSGWFLIRVISSANNNFRFASTAPFYVETATEKNIISRAACQFFMDWLQERAASIKLENKDQDNVVRLYIDEARKFWEQQLAQANAD